MRLYPNVPVVSDFNCSYLGAPSVYAEYTAKPLTPVGDISGTSAQAEPRDDTPCNTCRDALRTLTESPDECGTPFQIETDERTADADSVSYVRDPCTCPIRSAMLCAERTRYVDADFLMCREEKQLAIGAGVVGLAAGTGGAFAAGSAMAGEIMGLISGGMLGLDFASFNASKSPAFGNAIYQTDCIYRNTTPALREIQDIEATFEHFKVPTDCPSNDEPTIRLYLAEKFIGWQQLHFAAAQLNRSGLSAFQAIESAQVGGFANSQAGIVSPTQIGQGVSALNYTLPGVSLPSGGEAFQPTSSGKADLMMEPPTQTSCSFTQTEENSILFRASLAAFQLPDTQVQQCLSLNAGGGGGAASATASSGQKGASGPGNAPSGGPGGSPNGSTTSGTGSQGQGAGGQLAVALLNNTVVLDNRQSDACTTVQVTGGTPPYYWVAVDDQATHGVQVSSPEIRLKQSISGGQSFDGGRVLVADQGGSQQIVYVTSINKAPLPSPSATPTPSPGSAPCSNF
jgi:hypothetical protein